MSRELHIAIPIPPDSFYDKYTDAETLAYGFLSAWGEYETLDFTATWDSTYIIIDIGCLECGAPSELVEVTTAAWRVTELGATLRTDMGEHDWHGEVIRVAFEL